VGTGMDVFVFVAFKSGSGEGTGVGAVVLVAFRSGSGVGADVGVGAGASFASESLSVLLVSFCVSRLGQS